MLLVLASMSPRRAEVLRAAGFTFETCAVDVDESTRAGESPASYVRRLAAEKSARGAIAFGDHGPANRLRQGYGASRRSIAKAEAGHYVREGDRRERDVGKGDARENDVRGKIVVLGADTVVVVDGEMLGKPRDQGDAAVMLGRLSGRRHDVMTGVSLRAGAAEVGRVETTAVYFAPLGADEIAWYVASGEGLDKAGAYAIQGLASRFIPRIEGSYTNVVGLPLSCVYQLLKELGVRYSEG